MPQAIEYYFEDFEDITQAIPTLRDLADPVLDWDAVKNELRGLHQTMRSQK